MPISFDIFDMERATTSGSNKFRQEKDAEPKAYLNGRASVKR